MSSAKLDVPTQAEALIAVRKLEDKNPLLWDRSELEKLSVSLANCWPVDGANGMVECVTNVKKNSSAQAIARTVGFAKDQSSGEWIATDRK
ncbi:hypothetical protein P8H26_16720 [Pseudochrobactrum sp. sp1633]|uniref:hypothetical protein n=1 Tax=Pseudochrobactrum sp. sp1633 TaxID=3036706 RepID=UPI0025A6444D|nr:hypothetical protein [Pseudochrobactrum sp. sp1633]MDM8347029.1 hypothetical protein [Pseudochrobactrum sp. sp1633]